MHPGAPCTRCGNVTFRRNMSLASEHLDGSFSSALASEAPFHHICGASGTSHDARQCPGHNVHDLSPCHSGRPHVFFCLRMEWLSGLPLYLKGSKRMPVGLDGTHTKNHHYQPGNDGFCRLPASRPVSRGRVAPGSYLKSSGICLISRMYSTSPLLSAIVCQRVLHCSLPPASKALPTSESAAISMVQSCLKGSPG